MLLFMSARNIYIFQVKVSAALRRKSLENPPFLVGCYG